MLTLPLICIILLRLLGNKTIAAAQCQWQHPSKVSESGISWTRVFCEAHVCIRFETHSGLQQPNAKVGSAQVLSVSLLSHWVQSQM
jgi:hypothetical protein